MEANEFDYVIVGAGSAGCVLANRLSADPGIRVALIEAGKRDTNFMIHMPAGFGKTANEPGESWHYHSEPEPHLNGRPILLPRGKGLGGSSNINGLVYIRGHPADYDGWTNDGAIGWGWAEVLPYFRRAERHQSGGNALHGADGPLHVSDTGERDSTNDAIIRAFTQIGVPPTDDFNGPDQEGAGYFHTTIRDGRRCSAAVAYLRPAEKRRNLTIITRAHVRRVMFQGRRACGVELDGRAGMETISARREVILSAGAYHSPQLLQLSGIGPGAHLNALGIPVLADRAEVGANLQDHLLPPMGWRLRQGAFSYNDELKGLRLVWNVMRYLATRKGPMTIPAAQSGAFVKSDPALDRPDIQFHCLPVTGDLQAEARGEKNQLSPYPGLTMGPYVLRPESRGTAMAASPDPHAHPRILTNFLQAAEDQRLTVKGMRIARSVAAAPALAALIEDESDPGPGVVSDDDLLAYARTYGTTAYHPVGTCRMGVGEDAVVDNLLRVKGVEGLRVVDASVMPRLISGNTNAAAIMIGEKASDLILADWR